jgi:hypothetical protein
VPEWTLLVAGAIGAVVGRRVAARWPRRRLYSTTEGYSVIPPGARPVPGDDECTGAGHNQLGWTEHVVRPWRGGTWSEITEATCRDCGRPQTQVRVVYPPDRTIPVHSPQPREARRAPRRRADHNTSPDSTAAMEDQP